MKFLRNDSIFIYEIFSSYSRGLFALSLQAINILLTILQFVTLQQIH